MKKQIDHIYFHIWLCLQATIIAMTETGAFHAARSGKKCTFSWLKKMYLFLELCILMRWCLLMFLMHDLHFNLTYLLLK